MSEAVSKPKNVANRRNQPWRSIEDWALAVLVDTHAVVACNSHGFMRDAADPDAWRRASDVAAHHPFHGATSLECLQALDEVMHSVGDTCPECDTEG
ncbi:MAG: hypothetical protein K2W78_13795 [Xanthobacteraceae bacterium]|nr:hypothetical protein [Xanthobacteraceae bacterium]